METRYSTPGLPLPLSGRTPHGAGRYGSIERTTPEPPEAPGTPEPDGGVDILVRGGQGEAPELPRQRPTWCSTLRAALRSGTGKAGAQLASAALGAAGGFVIKKAATTLVVSPAGTVLVLAAAGGLVLASSDRAGRRASQLMKAAGYCDGLALCVRLAPVVMPLGRALLTGALKGSWTDGALCLGASLASTTCSYIRDGTAATLRGVLPESVPVDDKGRPMTGEQLGTFQDWTTSLAVVGDAGLAYAGNSHVAANLQGVIAPFDGAGDIAVYAGLRGGFAFIQEGAKALVGRCLHGGLDSKDGKGYGAFAENVFTEAGRRETWKHLDDNVSMRIAVNAMTVEACTGLEDAIRGGDNPLGPTRVVTSIALGFGESRGLLVERGRAAEQRQAEPQPGGPDTIELVPPHRDEGPSPAFDRVVHDDQTLVQEEEAQPELPDPRRDPPLPAPRQVPDGLV